MPSLVATESVPVDVLENEEFEARLASALADAVEFVQARANPPRSLQVDLRFKHRLPVSVELELRVERGVPPVVLGKKQIEAGSAGLQRFEGLFPGIQSETLSFVARLTRTERLPETKGAVLPDREFRFPDCKIQYPKPAAQRR